MCVASQFLHLIISRFAQGSRFSPKHRAQPLFPVFYDILLKCRSASSSPSYNKWSGPTPLTLSDHSRRGFHAPSEMEAISNFPDSSPPYPVPPLPPFNTSTTNHQSLAFDSSSFFLSPESGNSVGSPSDFAATLAQQRAKLKATSNAADRISAPALFSSAGERGTSRSAITRLRWICLPRLGRPAHRAPTFPPSPAAQLSALHAPMAALPPSRDYPPLRVTW